MVGGVFLICKELFSRLSQFEFANGKSFVCSTELCKNGKKIAPLTIYISGKLEPLLKHVEIQIKFACCFHIPFYHYYFDFISAILYSARN